MLENIGRGVSIQDLWDSIKSRRGVTNDLKERIDRILTMALGTDWRRSDQVIFDVEQAMRSLRLYKAEDVPHVSRNLPPEVSEVRFRAELTDATSVNLTQVARPGSLIDVLFG